MGGIFFYLVSLFLLLSFFNFVRRGKWQGHNKGKVPPGSMGIPVIGQSLSLARAMRSGHGEKWVSDRIKKYGPVSKMRFLGKPTVLIHGPAANKLVFAGDSNTISHSQSESMKRIMGERNLLELSGEDHRRMRIALGSFLKRDRLKNFTGKIEDEVKLHIEEYWKGKQRITVLPLMKELAFNIICSLLAGIERGSRREEFLKLFRDMSEGLLSIPINFPFTRFNRSLKAKSRVRKLLSQLITEKRKQLQDGDGDGDSSDLITTLLIENGTDPISESEIEDNMLLVMIGGHDTTAILLTYMIRAMAKYPNVYEAVCEEQEKIKKRKKCGELLRWEDVAEMRYTWRVAQETLRLIPPVFGDCRKALTDIEYDGYIIPKGWQIYWNSIVTHMDEDVFPDPRKFDPARFENPAQIPPYYYIPFGGGSHICPGYELAKIITVVAFHHLVTEFEWKLGCEEEDDDKIVRDPMPDPPEGLPIRIISKKAV